MLGSIWTTSVSFSKFPKWMWGVKGRQEKLSGGLVKGLAGINIGPRIRMFGSGGVLAPKSKWAYNVRTWVMTA